MTTGRPAANLPRDGGSRGDMRDLRYSTFLAERLAAAVDARKVERTRIKLEIAAAELLNEGSYRDLTVTGITRRAGSAYGTFYRYYPSKREIALSVLQGLLGAIRLMRPPGAQRPTEPYGRIFRATLNYVHVYRQNVGLFHCLLLVKHEDEAFAAIGRQSDEGLARRVLDSADRQGLVLPFPDRARALLAVYGMMSLIDELLRKIYGASEPAIAAFGNDAATVAEAISTLWYRGLYGRDVPPEVMAAARDMARP